MINRKSLFWILTVLLVFLLQVTISDRISIYGAAPNLFVLSTIYFAIRGGPLAGEILGFIFGLINDVTSVSVFGSQTFMMILIGYLAGRLERKVDEEKYSAQMALVLLMSFVNLLGILFWETLFGGVPQRFRDKFMILVPIYSTVICPALFWGLMRWGAFFRRAGLKNKSL